MAKKKTEHFITVGELIEMLSKNNWKNKVYICDGAIKDFVLNAVGNIGKCYAITGVSSYSGGTVTINFESKK